MYFWLICFCLIWSSIQVERISEEKPFDIMPVGYSGLLIFWHRNKFANLKYNQYFNFTCHVMIEKVEIFAKTFTEISVTDDQYQISGLNESTNYHIYITQYQWPKNNVIGNYSIKAKTNLKTNFPPEKPDFEWAMKGVLTIRIYWLPCGKERKCNGKEAGTHFSVRYKLLDSRHWFKSHNIYDSYYDLNWLFPGKIYEVIVTSENGVLKTDSDPQEVFYEPISGPVHSVKVMPLTNTSALISWKSPQQSISSIDTYYISHNSFNNGITVAHLHYVAASFPMLCSREVCKNITQDYSTLYWKMAINQNNYEQIKISNLKPSTKYTFSIIPDTSGMNHGFGYTFEYTMHPHHNITHRTLATPAIRCSTFRSTKCFLIVEWLPCGQKLVCENSRPGSAFNLKVENFTGNIIRDMTEKDGDYTSFVIEKKEKLNVTVTSIDGNTRSDTVSKIITILNNCSIT